MVVRRRKKYRKYLGKRYARRGYNDRNRGAGNRGGRGKAGWRLKKQKFHKVLREHPEILKDKKGFVPPRQKEIIPINLDQLDELIQSLKTNGLLKEENGKIVVNLLDLGYNKLLGRGNINYPIKVITQYITESAKEKIEKAGGEVVLAI